MSAYKTYWLCLIGISLTLPTMAQDYKLPRNVTILSEPALLEQFAGNSVFNEIYTEHYVLPESEHKQGPLRGSSKTYGEYEGHWQIEGELLCIEYYQRLMSALGNCYTAARIGDEIRIYRRDGYELYPDGGRLKPVSGNPENL